jgi:hypothetical protein
MSKLQIWDNYLVNGAGFHIVLFKKTSLEFYKATHSNPYILDESFPYICEEAQHVSNDIKEKEKKKTNLFVGEDPR